MLTMKIRIDYNVDPSFNNDAKQVVYLEEGLEETDIKNLIGKTITNVEYENFHNCLVFTLSEDVETIPTQEDLGDKNEK